MCIFDFLPCVTAETWSPCQCVQHAPPAPIQGQLWEVLVLCEAPVAWIPLSSVTLLNFSPRKDRVPKVLMCYIKSKHNAMWRSKLHQFYGPERKSRPCHVLIRILVTHFCQWNAWFLTHRPPRDPLTEKEWRKSSTWRIGGPGIPSLQVWLGDNFESAHLELQ